MSDNGSNVSIVVPSFQPGEQICRCLDSILLAGTRRSFDLWVVDSSPTSIEPLLRDYLSDSRINLVRSERRLYAGAARDLGVRLSQGEFVVFTDCDCTVVPGWPDGLIDVLEEGGFAACGGGILNGTPESYFGTAEYLCGLSAFTPRNRARHERFVPSGNMAIRRHAYLASGGFSAEMRAGEDVALGKRLITAHQEIWFVPGAAVVHHNRTGAREFLRDQYLLGKGAAANFLAGNQPYSAWRKNLFRRILFDLFAGPARLTRVTGRILSNRELTLSRFIYVFPGLMLGSICFGLGFVATPKQSSGV